MLFVMCNLRFKSKLVFEYLKVWMLQISCLLCLMHLNHMIWKYQSKGDRKHVVEFFCELFL
jgi:hypothetical protein